MTSATRKVLSVVLSVFSLINPRRLQKTFGLLQEHKCFASLDLRYLAIPRAAFLGGFFLQHFGCHLHFLTSFSFLFFFRTILCLQFYAKWPLILFTQHIGCTCISFVCVYFFRDNVFPIQDASDRSMQVKFLCISPIRTTCVSL